MVKSIIKLKLKLCPCKSESGARENKCKVREKKFPHTNYLLIYHLHPLLITVNKFPHGYYFHMYTTVKLSKVKLYLHRVAHSALRLVSVGALYLKKYSMIS